MLGFIFRRGHQENCGKKLFVVGRLRKKLFYFIYVIKSVFLKPEVSTLNLLAYWSQLIMLFIIHSVFCLTTGPKPPPIRCLHTVRSRASSFKREYPLLSLRSSSSFLRLLPHLLATSMSPFIFPSITCFRRQFLRKMRITLLSAVESAIFMRLPAPSLTQNFSLNLS